MGIFDAVGSAIDGAVHTVGHAASSAAGTVEHATASAAGAVEHAAGTAAGAVEDTAKLGAHAVASGAKGIYQFAVGDDIDTLRNGKSSWWQKGLAVADIASNFVAPEFKGAEVAGKLALKGVEHAAVHTGESAAVHAGEHVAEHGAVQGGEHAAAKGEQKLAAHLEPNQKFERNGYHFETDSQGRLSRATTEHLRLDSSGAVRDRTAQRTVGGADRLPTDAGGHLIGHRFGGPGDFANLVPQDAKLNNQRPWKSLENLWANSIKAGKDVSVDIRPVYQGSSLRPAEFDVRYSVDGEPFKTTIANKTGG